MILHETSLEGVYVVEPERAADDRGFFARTYSSSQFAEWGLELAITECSIAYNRARWTIRGLHYQKPPHEEAKIVRCTNGAVYDVAVDLRPNSRTYLRWEAIELTAENRIALYVPPGCAHGYQTLREDSELHYAISTAYAPEAGAGVRWNDPLLGIDWPASPSVISPRDKAYPDLEVPGYPLAQ